MIESDRVHIRSKIDELVEAGHEKIVIMPMGEFGNYACGYLHSNYGIEPYMMLDNYKGDGPSIYPVCRLFENKSPMKQAMN